MLLGHWASPGLVPRFPSWAGQIAGEYRSGQVQPFTQGQQFFGGDFRRGQGFHFVGTQCALAAAFAGPGFAISAKRFHFFHSRFSNSRFSISCSNLRSLALKSSISSLSYGDKSPAIRGIEPDPPGAFVSNCRPLRQARRRAKGDGRLTPP